MKHLVTISEMAYRDVVIDTGIDDPEESREVASEVALDLYYNGVIEMNYFGDINTEIKDCEDNHEYKEVYNNEGELL